MPREPQIFVMEPAEALNSADVIRLNPKQRVEIGALMQVYAGDSIGLTNAVRITAKGLKVLEESFTQTERNEIAGRVRTLLREPDNSDLTDAIMDLEKRNYGRIIGSLFTEVRLALQMMQAKRHKASYRDLASSVTGILGLIVQIKALSPKESDPEISFEAAMQRKKALVNRTMPKNEQQALKN